MAATCEEALLAANRMPSAVHASLWNVPVSPEIRLLLHRRCPKSG